MTGRELVAALAATDDRIADLAMYADYLGMEPEPDEAETGFRERVAGGLRARGMVIEAHEVLRGRRWDDPADPGLGHPESVLTGLAGAVALAEGELRSPDPMRQVGDELAAGVVAAAPRSGFEQALRAGFDLLGPAATMDLLDPRRVR